MPDKVNLRKLYAAAGLLAFLAGGCVPPEKPPGRRLVRVALLRGAHTLTLSSKSLLTVKDELSGKVLFRVSRGAPVTVTFSPEGMSIAGKAYQAGTLHVKSTSHKISLNGKTYPGSIRILRKASVILAVNLVDLETYLKAVVPSEMLPSWPREALKAQAVVSRSFVLHHAFRNKEKDYDITSATQVYNPDNRDPRADKAVDATKNIVLFHKGNLLLPFFCTCCGGFTEYAANVWETEEQYPPPVECPFCRGAPDYEWRARVTLDELQRKLRSAGVSSAHSIAVHRRSTSGGRITALKVRGEDGYSIVKINRFRMLMGPNIVRSGFFDLQVKDNYITFSGHGWGHGVGMCQRGAKVLAEHGKSFRSVLQYYFPGARTRKFSW